MPKGVLAMPKPTEKTAPQSWKVELPAAHWLVIIAAGLFVLSSLLLWQTKFPLFMDEAIFFDMIFRFRTGHGFTTELFAHYIPYVDQFAYWYPPGYFWILAGLYQVFGQTILVGRLFSLFCIGLVVAGIYLISKRNLGSSYAVAAVLLLLLNDPYVQDAAIVARMEPLAILFGLAAVLSHLRAIDTAHPRWNFVSGILGGLSLLTHPTGSILVLPIAISIVATHYKNWRKLLTHALLFGLPIVIGLGIWALSFWDNLDIFMLQNLVQMHRKTYGMYFILESIKFKPLHGILLITYLLSNLVYVFTVIRTGLYRQAEPRLLAFLAITATLLPILMKEMWYVVYLPVIATLLLLKNIEYWGKNKLYWSIPGLSLLLLVGLWIGLTKTTTALEKTQSYTEFGALVASQLPEGSSVLLSSLPDPYFYLQQHRPDLHLIESPNAPSNEPIDVAVYNQVLQEVDYAVVSFVLSEYIAQYLRENQAEVLYQAPADTAQYSVLILQLKPQAERTELEVPAQLHWQYPELK